MKLQELITERLNPNSPNFRVWFGNSKVINKRTRQPLLLYHATISPREFGRLRGLSHFGTLEATEDLIQDEPGPHRVFPVYLRIENPIRIQDPFERHNAYIYAKLILESRTIRQKGLKQQIQQLIETWKEKKTPESQRLLQLIKPLSAAGYDGFVYKNEVEHAGSTSWVPFRSSQIKYAYAE